MSLPAGDATGRSRWIGRGLRVCAALLAAGAVMIPRAGAEVGGLPLQTGQTIVVGSDQWNAECPGGYYQGFVSLQCCVVFTCVTTTTSTGRVTTSSAAARPGPTSSSTGSSPTSVVGSPTGTVAVTPTTTATTTVPRSQTDRLNRTGASVAGDDEADITADDGGLPVAVPIAAGVVLAVGAVAAVLVVRSRRA